MSKKRVHVFVEGKVQGVFFRATTRDNAVKRDIGGWVKNLPDGRVEAVFEGDEEMVDEMIDFCWEGPERAEVTNVEVRSEQYKNEFGGFKVKY